MTNQVDALGQIAGGPIVGVVGRLRSIRAALTTSALILLPVLPLFQRVLNRSEGKSTQKEASI
jgi:DHA3 family tetracycline resistance protein-like MFS transporter